MLKSGVTLRNTVLTIPLYHEAIKSLKCIQYPKWYIYRKDNTVLLRINLGPIMISYGVDCCILYRQRMMIDNMDYTPA